MATKEEMQYDIDALKRLVDKRHQNIAVFEKAIADERAHIERERGIIATLEAEARYK